MAASTRTAKEALGPWRPVAPGALAPKGVPQPPLAPSQTKLWLCAGPAFRALGRRWAFDVIFRFIRAASDMPPKTPAPRRPLAGPDPCQARAIPPRRARLRG